MVNNLIYQPQVHDINCYATTKSVSLALTSIALLLANVYTLKKVVANKECMLFPPAIIFVCVSIGLLVNYNMRSI